jgi:hypothetical protein
MGEGAAHGDEPSRNGPLVLRLFAVMLIGFSVGLLVTAPILGWPRAVFPGMMRESTQSRRQEVGYSVIIGTGLAGMRVFGRWIALGSRRSRKE